MDSMKTRVTNRERLDPAMSVITRYTEEYLFFLDFENDCYGISEAAVKKFNLPGAKFKNVYDVFKSVIYEEDYEIALHELQLLKLGYKEAHQLKFRWRDKDGKIVWMMSKGELLSNEHHQSNILLGRICEIDVSSDRGTETGLRTELQFMSDYEEYRSRGNCKAGYIILLGIDSVKAIYEKYGKAALDSVMENVSNCIQRILPKENKAYRFGTVQFAVFVPIQENSISGEAFYKKLQKEIESYEESNPLGIFYTLKAGVVKFREQLPCFQEIRRQLEFSFLTSYSKEEKNLYIYNEEAYSRYIRNRDLKEELRRDVKDGFRGFCVFYQPIVEGQSLNIQGAEALLRWESEKFGFISPAEFVPLLEETGLIIPVGTWIMRNAINTCKKWQQYIPKFHVNINLSYVQLKNGDIAGEVLHALDYYGLDSKYVLLELTESGHIESNDSVRQVIRHLHKKKVKLGIDDFGTGYSNLTYLQDMKIYVIKMDRTFVAKAMENDYYFNILSHVIDMAKGIGLKVCIEGVETKEELQKLRSKGGDFYQGYYFGKPVDAETFFERNIKKTV